MTRYNGPLDVSHGEPDKRHTTMLDILSFTDPRVRNLMIDTMKIEGMVLVKEQRIGDALMFENKPEHTRITSCYDVDLHRIGGILCVRSNCRAATIELMNECNTAGVTGVSTSRTGGTRLV